ncbi:MAG: low molecular weight protein-tyrosine-phosphatase [Balneolales bacterium]
MQTQTKLTLRNFNPQNPLKICFVCLGNICRSPTAEGVFQHIINREGLSLYAEVDSAGTAAYHVGEPANSKSIMVAEQNGVKLLSKARKFEYTDLEYFDLIIAMDHSNYHDLQALDRHKKFHKKIFLLREFDSFPGDKNIPDPYYGGLNGFELVYEMVLRSCEQLFKQIQPFISDRM